MAKERAPWRRRAIKFIVGTAIVGTIGFVASVYQIAGGPPWPVAPTFVPGFPSSGNAFDVPFSVTNKSALFSLDHLKITCRLENVSTDTNVKIAQLPITASDGEASLRPLQSASYGCPFPNMFKFPEGSKLTAATIIFITNYDTLWVHTQSESDPFSLNTKTNPPQWTTGKTIQ